MLIAILKDEECGGMSQGGLYMVSGVIRRGTRSIRLGLLRLSQTCLVTTDEKRRHAPSTTDYRPLEGILIYLELPRLLFKVPCRAAHSEMRKSLADRLRRIGTSLRKLRLNGRVLAGKGMLKLTLRGSRTASHNTNLQTNNVHTDGINPERNRYHD